MTRVSHVVRRRDALRLIGGGVMMMTGASAGAKDSEPTVETSLGTLRGLRRADHVAFLGVRYAQAARFEPPSPPVPTVGVIDAVAYGAIAPQTDPDPEGPPSVILAHLPRPPGAPPPPKAPESEDCLFLNVWTPTTDRTRKLPVMVWLHGGFFYSGSGATGDGSRLAARGDVVVVSLNHRLNAFGYAHLDGLGGDFAHTGNLGMLDIVAALQWIRDNIAGFGGDPARVMVFGTSGGGMKAGWLLASPSARGLVARAGVQSGPVLKFTERDRAALATERFLRELGLTSANAADLRTLPASNLLRAYYRVMRAHPARSFTDLPGFAPVLDDALLPRHPFDPAAPNQARDIPLLIGSNADDLSFFTGNDRGVFDLDDGSAFGRARSALGERADTIWQAYREALPLMKPGARLLRLMSDVEILMPTLAEADRKAAQHGAAVYMYRLDWRSPVLDGRFGATHTIDSALVFGQVGAPLVSGGRQVDRVSRAMGDAWANFAATGRPRDDWPAWDSSAKAMRIDEDWTVERDFYAPMRAILPQPR